MITFFTRRKRLITFLTIKDCCALRWSLTFLSFYPTTSGDLPCELLDFTKNTGGQSKCNTEILLHTFHFHQFLRLLDQIYFDPTNFLMNWFSSCCSKMWSCKETSFIVSEDWMWMELTSIKASIWAPEAEVFFTTTSSTPPYGE